MSAELPKAPTSEALEGTDTLIEQWIARAHEAVKAHSATAAWPTIFRTIGFRPEELGEAEKKALFAAQESEEASVLQWAIGVRLACSDLAAQLAMVIEHPFQLPAFVEQGKSLADHASAWLNEIGEAQGEPLAAALSHLRAAVARLKVQVEQGLPLVDSSVQTRLRQFRYEAERYGVLENVTREEMDWARQLETGAALSDADRVLLNWCVVLVAARLALGNSATQTIASWAPGAQMLILNLLERHGPKAQAVSKAALERAYQSLGDRLAQVSAGHSSLKPLERPTRKTTPATPPRVSRAQVKVTPRPTRSVRRIGGNTVGRVIALVSGIVLIGLLTLVYRLSGSTHRDLPFTKQDLGALAQSFREVRLSHQPEGVAFIGRLVSGQENLRKQDLTRLLNDLWQKLRVHNIRSVLLLDQNEVPVARHGPPGGRKIWLQK